jgi:uridine kinase
MTIYILVSGLLRSFEDTLFPFLCEVNRLQPIQVLIATPDDTYDTKFTGTTIHKQLERLVREPFVKLAILNSLDITSLTNYTQRERNTWYQWYNLYTIFQILHTRGCTDTDILVRIRPDIRFECQPQEFIRLLHQAQNTQGVLIPKGNDLFHKDFQKYTSEPLNDQIAIGLYQYMSVYCTMYKEKECYLDIYPKTLISEESLSRYLKEKTIPIHRVELPYTLCLSQCTMIAIAGDSGVGKSTLSSALQKIFPYDSNMLFETDRYHKWERGHQNWTNLTHLHPEANYLEKLQDDTYILKMGGHIQQVDYDHATGRFTEPCEIESKSIVVLCGLHTLYKEEMRSNLDLRIFLDAEPSLKRLWKIQRDMRKRGYSYERAHELYEARLKDYVSFIQPQQESCDIDILYSADGPLPEHITVDAPLPPIRMTVSLHSIRLPPSVRTFLKSVSDYKVQNTNPYNPIKPFEYTIRTGLDRTELYSLLPEEYKKFSSVVALENGFLGVLQLVTLLCVCKESETPNARRTDDSKNG